MKERAIIPPGRAAVAHPVPVLGFYKRSQKCILCVSRDTAVSPNIPTRPTSHYDSNLRRPVFFLRTPPFYCDFHCSVIVFIASAARWRSTTVRPEIIISYTSFEMYTYLSSRKRGDIIVGNFNGILVLRRRGINVVKSRGGGRRK